MVALIQRVVPVICLAVGAVAALYGLAAGNHGAITGGVLLLATGVSMWLGVSRSLGRATGTTWRRDDDTTRDRQ